MKGDESGKPIKDDIDKPICKLCKKPVSAKRSNTTNLFQHLQEHHLDTYSEIDVAIHSLQNLVLISNKPDSLSSYDHFIVFVDLCSTTYV